MAIRYSKRILLVDNDESMLDVLTIVLKGCGYKLLVARDGLEAMRSVQEQEPDLIIMELMLPVLDGPRLLRWLRGQQDSTLPVMVLTALDRSAAQDTVAGLGVDELIYKPVGRSELVKRVRKMLPVAPVARVAAAG